MSKAMHSISRRILISIFATVFPGTLMAQTDIPTPTSKYFEVANFGYFGSAADTWLTATLRGYIEDLPSDGNPKIMVLPDIALKTSSISVLGVDGAPFDLVAHPGRQVELIELRADFVRDQTNPQYRAAFAGAATKDPQKFVIPDIVRDGAGQPYLDPEFNMFADPGTRSAVMGAMFHQAGLKANQDALIQKIDQYDVTPVSVDNVEIRLVLDGEVLAERKFSGSLITTSSKLPALVVRKPSAFQARRIVDGAAELHVSFSFNDSSTAFIDAQFNTALTIDRVVNVHKKLVTRQSSAGFRILGFSWRRNSVRQSIQEQIDQQFTADLVENTHIVMSNANDKMLDRFDSAFFPVISRQQTIDNHLAAAETAKAEGNLPLAQLHLDYAKSVQDGLEFDDVDLTKAAAALAAQDYATFLAAGVRAGLENSSQTTEYRRLDRSDTNINQQKDWFEAQSLTISRQIDYVVSMNAKQPSKSYIGMCNGAGFQFTRVFGCSTGSVFSSLEKGVMLTCISNGGPIAQAGIGAGVIMTHFDGNRVTDEQSLTSALESVRPGEHVTMRLYRAPTPGSVCTGSQSVSIHVGTAPDF